MLSALFGYRGAVKQTRRKLGLGSRPGVAITQDADQPRPVPVIASPVRLKGLIMHSIVAPSSHHHGTIGDCFLNQRSNTTEAMW